MVSEEYRKQYQTRYETGTNTDPTSGDVLLETGTPPSANTDIENEGQLTTLRVYSEGDISLVVKEKLVDADGVVQSEQEKFNASGVTELSEGDFEDPVFEAGALSRISVEATSDLTGEVSINATIDERTG